MRALKLVLYKITKTYIHSIIRVQFIYYNNLNHNINLSLVTRHL